MPADGDDPLKQTNAIGMAIPTLTPLALSGKTLTADALLTQRSIAEFLIARGAHYVFTVKANQPTLYEDVRLTFETRGTPDFSAPPTLAHGRIEQRTIWITTRLNGYLRFPGVAQAFMIERTVIEKKSGKTTTEPVYGITSHTAASADPARVLRFKRAHWSIENSCHYRLNWNWDEDRCPIRTGHGPENMTARRRFAIGVIKATSSDTVAATIQRLARSPRLVFEYLCLNDAPGDAIQAPSPPQARTDSPWKRKGNPYVRRILCEAANAASNTISASTELFKSLLIRRGRKRAIFALAHKILKIVFVLISRGDYYRDATVDDEAMSVERNAPRWIRMLKRYGYLSA